MMKFARGIFLGVVGRISMPERRMKVLILVTVIRNELTR